MILICYDGSADAQAAIDRAGLLMPGSDARVARGLVLSGDQFMNPAQIRDLRRRFPDGLAVEMEGAALRRCASNRGPPTRSCARSAMTGTRTRSSAFSTATAVAMLPRTGCKATAAW